MYAAIPYEILGIDVSCENKVERGESVQIELAINADTTHLGPHAVWVQVVCPNSAELEYFRRMVYLPQGRAGFSFVPALNAPVGLWQIKVVECVSGKEAQKEIVMK